MMRVQGLLPRNSESRDGRGAVEQGGKVWRIIALETRGWGMDSGCFEGWDESCARECYEREGYHVVDSSEQGGVIL